MTLFWIWHCPGLIFDMFWFAFCLEIVMGYEQLDASTTIHSFWFDMMYEVSILLKLQPPTCHIFQEFLNFLLRKTSLTLMVQSLMDHPQIGPKWYLNLWALSTQTLDIWSMDIWSMDIWTIDIFTGDIWTMEIWTKKSYLVSSSF